MITHINDIVAIADPQTGHQPVFGHGPAPSRGQGQGRLPGAGGAGIVIGYLGGLVLARRRAP